MAKVVPRRVWSGRTGVRTGDAAAVPGQVVRSPRPAAMHLPEVVERPVTTAPRLTPSMRRLRRARRVSAMFRCRELKPARRAVRSKSPERPALRRSQFAGSPARPGSEPERRTLAHAALDRDLAAVQARARASRSRAPARCRPSRASAPCPRGRSARRSRGWSVGRDARSGVPHLAPGLARARRRSAHASRAPRSVYLIALSSRFAITCSIRTRSALDAAPAAPGSQLERPARALRRVARRRRRCAAASARRSSRSRRSDTSGPLQLGQRQQVLDQRLQPHGPVADDAHELARGSRRRRVRPRAASRRSRAAW